MLFEDFLKFCSGGHFVWRSRLIGFGRGHYVVHFSETIPKFKGKFRVKMFLFFALVRSKTV